MRKFCDSETTSISSDPGSITGNDSANMTAVSTAGPPQPSDIRMDILVQSVHDMQQSVADLKQGVKDLKHSVNNLTQSVSGLEKMISGLSREK